jgi:hypothetical protein
MLDANCDVVNSAGVFERAELAELISARVAIRLPRPHGGKRRDGLGEPSRQ